MDFKQLRGVIQFCPDTRQVTILVTEWLGDLQTRSRDALASKKYKPSKLVSLIQFFLLNIK